MAELKKCPFCGGEAEVTITETVSCLDYESLEYHDCVWCPECHATIEGDTKEEVIESWNGRATEAELRANVIDEFAEALYKKSTDLKDIEDENYGMIHYEEVYEIALQMKGEKE